MSTLVISRPYQSGGGSIVRARFMGDLKIISFAFVPSTNYATGGDVIAAADFPSGVKDWIVTGPNGTIQPINGPLSIYTLTLDVVNSKLKFFVTTTMAEVAAAQNPSTLLGTTAINLFFLVR